MAKIVPQTYSIISLGCAKNLVDSNLIAQELSAAGYQPAEKAAQAQFLIVNTCGFIHDARDESLQALRKQAKNKRSGPYLLAAGCLSQRYQEQLLNDIPNLDGMIGTRNLRAILPLAQALKNKHTLPPLPESINAARILPLPERAHFAIQGASAYMKIADGCRRECAFCAIPQIKGPLLSRPLQEVLRDAKALQKLRTLELNLIAQDITDYGKDRGELDGLASLLDALLPQIKNIPWVRLLYTYPGSLTPRVLELLAAENQLLPYLDMPLQHASEPVLRSMRRPANMGWVYDTFAQLQSQIPALVTRTTLIVGYPTETEKDFQTLYDFVKQMQFDHLGVFTFSAERDTPSEALGDPIPQDLKQERQATIMQLQAEVSAKRLQALIGNEYDLLVEGSDIKQEVSVGRIYRDAPEIDGLVIANGFAPPGTMAKVRITGSTEHDLYGILLPANGQ
jgi:ribosomal protein S12 methylthiotransferase